MRTFGVNPLFVQHHKKKKKKKNLAREEAARWP